MQQSAGREFHVVFTGEIGCFNAPADFRVRYLSPTYFLNMGCDIHSIIEYDPWGNAWLAFGEISITRDYDLFSAIAFGDGGITDDLPYPPRGLPSGISFTTHDLFFMDGEEYKELMGTHGMDIEINPEEMEDWAKKEYLASGAMVGPDWHTPSWLNYAELTQALAQGGITDDKQSPELKATLGAMKVLTENYGNERVRLVFWFDG